ncbi:MAG: hypothetical protein ACOYXN_08235 [Acidobacteriota bacterium]
MRGFAAVYMREVLLRKAAFAAGLASGLVAVLLGGILRRYGFMDVANLAAATFSVLLGGFGALAVGASVIPNDLSSGKIGFDFARPVSGWAIWAGRFLGGFSVVLSMAVLPLAPVTLLGEGLLRDFTVINPAYLHGIGDYLLTPAGLYGSAVLALLALYAASICLWSILRIPSRWLALDALMAGVLFVAGILSLSSPVTLHFPGARYVYLFVLGIVFLGALVGTFLLVVRGRTDARRARTAVSLSLGASLFSALLLLGAGWAYVETRGPKHLQRLTMGERSPDGRWWLLSGSHVGKDWLGLPTYLLDAREGGHRRLSWSTTGWGDAAISPDGKFVAFIENRWSQEGAHWLLTCRTLSGERKWEILGPADGWDEPSRGAVTFSPFGKRLLFLTGGEGQVLDADDGSSLASFRVGADADLWLSGRFESEDRVRLYSRIRDRSRRRPGWPSTPLLDTAHVDLWRFDVPSRTLTRTGTLDTAFYFFWPVPTGDSIVVRSGPKDARGLDLHDGSTGVKKVHLLEGQERVWPLVLADGRIVCTARSRGEASDVLRVFSPEGSLLKSIPLPPRLKFSPVDELAGGNILLGSGPEKGRISEGDAYVADPACATAEPIHGLRIHQGYPLAEGRRMSPEREGLLESVLLLDKDNRLVRYDVRSRERHPLVRLPAPSKTGSG